ncbi:hypothetical protein [Rhizobium leguminosarum]|uniref:hypothetical protein n=1 Tax=Rhizobium leguminosarum TaxID=384 RepID=UPI0009B71D78|nr:hypothetical protein [Rhizobium leguminosarum]
MLASTPASILNHKTHKNGIPSDSTKSGYALNDASTADAVRCERAFLRTLNGSCRTPIGALAVCHGSEILLRGLSIDADGRNPRRVTVRGARTVPAALGEEAGRMVLARVGMASGHV